MYTSLSHKSRLSHIVYINKNCQTYRDGSSNVVRRAKTKHACYLACTFTLSLALSLAHTDQRLHASEVATVRRNLGDDDHKGAVPWTSEIGIGKRNRNDGVGATNQRRSEKCMH